MSPKLESCYTDFVFISRYLQIGVDCIANTVRGKGKGERGKGKGKRGKGKGEREKGKGERGKGKGEREKVLNTCFTLTP
ncbi:hypothetical protein VF14_16040 [Nostoc linckia z18]|uniref:Uncharacterized protein n=2 Tax=Nostoc linckia TaxID=92942 RepID=A0ABX4KIQ4_NOSLI|nr:hypothetical protein VF02_22685 [Nostoc linckia z1]PHJ67187.1 hypothetical protein VF03_26040 [Nostoc linckia z2]PHJ68161.1 hypothetical protein VF05_15805 [Nostoc linckia z3]PHJ82205.1 hypothetical protein VF06_16780 [Nostoc linckia z4]PHJ84662.1 hypothetical protein VF07_24945 [Nostoc linckia z6]PHJ94602.1 hypothetical protein VF04_21720 [Nostoc linckia z7]PHK10181.1 hypothetical protein VF09_12155 [Nostoc linckia z9]PHK33726.1 hypothetical protein VF14_16040 [Nostoc linckia z18]PHK452